ncbi:MAG: methyltransferase domain-containing protein [Anaerolineae bacterium]|jgi:SAM-dependent methyltransferase
MPPQRQYRYDSEHIAGFYDEYGMREWDRLTATPVDEINLHLHTHYLMQHIPAGAHVLEIGAGPGRFTQVLAHLGARIVVADISAEQLTLNKQQAEQLGFSHAIEDWRQVDICDLGGFAPCTFDRVVAYGGPLSYALDRRDAALAECIRVLKPRGTLLASVMSLWGTAHRVLDRVLEIPEAMGRKVVASGDLSPDTYGARGHYLHMFRASEFRAWLIQAGLTIITLSASNCLCTGWGGLLHEIRADEGRWNRLLRMELEACAAAGSLDMGTHIIAVVKKQFDGEHRGVSYEGGH